MAVGDVASDLLDTSQQVFQPASGVEVMITFLQSVTEEWAHYDGSITQTIGGKLISDSAAGFARLPIDNTNYIRMGGTGVHSYGGIVIG